MVNVDEALRVILQSVKPMPEEPVTLTQSLERILAENIFSSVNIPALDNSAMDGYALRAQDISGVSFNNPCLLEVVEDIKAGDMPKKKIKPGQAARIMTGAPVPYGANAVVMVEQTEKLGKTQVKIFKSIKPGENIRRKAEDIQKGELVISKGTRLNAGHVGLLASLGRPKMKVVRRPKVAVLATGDELVGVGEKLRPGKLRSSNSYTLYSQVINCGGTPKNLGIARDKPVSLESKLKAGLGCDLILTSGGVSVGDYDLVKFILARMGTQIRFWQVAMRPGKPLVFGMLKGIPIFGLPGNPVSSMVSFEIFVRPALLKMQGQKQDSIKEITAVLEEDIPKKKGLRYFLRAKTAWKDGRYFTRTTGPQGSGILKSMALANSLIILPEAKEFVAKGAQVSVRFLN